MPAASRASGGAALLAALTALTLAAVPAPAATRPASVLPNKARAYIAHPVMRVAVRAAPGGRIVAHLETQTPWAGEPVGVLVLDRRTRGRRDWLRVRLPDRPNTASGWVSADLVRLTSTPWRITVHLDSRRVVVTRSGRRVRTISAVVGKPSTPTPQGLHAIWERARQPNPNDFDGAWVLHLTAHSNVLRSFGGGPGRIGIHGRGGSSLYDPLGSARSHGCVRVDNAQVSWLAGIAVPGTPVRIMP